MRPVGLIYLLFSMMEWTIQLQKFRKKTVLVVYGFFLVVILVWFGIILQPLRSSSSLYPVQDPSLGMNFTSISLPNNDVQLEIEFGIKRLANFSWSIGFDVRSGKDAEKQVAYVWLYQEVINKDVLNANIRLWITCQGNEKRRFVEKPWEQQWDPSTDNQIKITLTQDEIIASTGLNYTFEESHECKWDQWSSVLAPFKLRLVCWRLGGYCPIVNQQCHQDKNIINFLLVLDMLSFVCMGLFLGVNIAVFWVYTLDINVWQMVAVGSGEEKEGRSNALSLVVFRRGLNSQE
ncbi:hypothetical protein Pmani_032436 [Petrolisthes manimaculis]|uniref:Uncharacterized protein n=1 Tax=Petrolisthes manimaculis TaxID=1843537 RepID=A0AAE1TRP0_9EUCA|nr:hypothetical protein Pmani_032436 [Petrolisthes manimaculis]